MSVRLTGAKRRVLARLRVVAVAAVVGTALTGCAQQGGENPEPTPTSIETEAPKTIDEYAVELAEYADVDPATLRLPVGATAEDFGRWVTDLNNNWVTASCDRVKDIIKSSVELGVVDDSVEFYPKIAEANGDSLATAMFGSNWQSIPNAVDWHDVSVKANAVGLDFCVQNLTDQIITQDFISAETIGSDEDGDPIFSVNVNLKSSSPEATNIGPRTYTYHTGVDGDFMTVESIS